MGKTTVYIVVAVLLVLLSIFIILHFKYTPVDIKEPIASDGNTTSIKEDNQIYEENRTKLDYKYDTVLEFESRVNRDILSLERDLNLTDSNQNVTIKEDIPISLEKIEEEQNKSKLPKLPKLAIIMDDVGFLEQVEMIKKIPYPITPSIFPPNSHYSDTEEIAKEFKYYMVHLPLEAEEYLNIREKAIKIFDSKDVIEDKILSIKRSFPDALAINNHTGSKFTCDLGAMDRLFSVLKTHNIRFIDSRTAPNTKCPEAASKNSIEILQRDIFLDNRSDIEYIRGRLKEAVEIAKKRGYAIAICHPKDETFKALMGASDLFDGIELVYINELL